MKKVMDYLKWAYKYRNIALAIPVVAIAIILAVVNAFALPAAVPVSVLWFSEGVLIFPEFMVIKLFAILIPLIVTAASLGMMFLSKRVSFPFLVSLFSLVLPIFFMIAAKLPG